MARQVSSGDSWSVAGATTFLKGGECDVAGGIPPRGLVRFQGNLPINL